MVTFEESKMTFSFEDSSVFRIEKSELLAEVEMKATECVVAKGKGLVFIEAKSSAPRPESHEDFRKYINEITSKFAHSILFLNALRTRHREVELPEQIVETDSCTVLYSFVLIIHGHRKEWIPPVMNALKKQMRHVLRLWNVSDTAVKVINDEIALKSGMIIATR